MKKLFALKQWLTVADTAKHLSILMEEKVSEADVLRLALDGHLKLSVNFVNHAKAKAGKVVPIEEAAYQYFKPEHIPRPSLPKDYNGEPVKVLEGIELDESRVLELNDEIVTLEGVYDLAMLGGDRHDVEHRYQTLTGGPAVSLQSLEGAFVKSIDGETVYQLHERFDADEIANLSDGIRSDFERAARFKGFGLRAVPDLHSSLDTNRGPRLPSQRIGLLVTEEDYFPASDLPEDSALVVRTAEIQAFERKVMGVTATAEKPLGTSEKTTLLVVIAALCHFNRLDISGRETVGQVEKLTEHIGAPLSNDTIRKVFKEIPNALERRMK